MSRLRWPLLLGIALVGCGEQEVDLEDELRGDYELVQLAQSKEPAGRQMPAPADSAGALVPSPASSAEGETPPEPPIAYDPEGEYTVQVGAFDEARLASERVRQLSAEGYPAYAIANTGNKGARVRIGYFRTREEAERFGRLFKKDKGAEFWVDRRANEKL